MVYKHLFRCFVVVITLFFLTSLSFSQTDIYEDASAYGYDVKQEEEDEIFFYESRFVDIGLHGGMRTFTGGLGNLFGLGPSFGGFLTYYFTQSFALEMTLNNSFHQFLIDGVRGWVSLLDIIFRGKYYFVSDSYSKALTYANPHAFLGVGEFIRIKTRSDVPTSTTDQGLGLEFGAGFEVPVKERQVFLGINSSYQLIFFQDENQKTSRGTQLDGDCVNLVATLTYTF